MVSRTERIEGLTLAQFQSFANKMPAYYLSVAAMMVATVYTFDGVAPRWLSLGTPAFFFVLCLARGAWWWRYRHAMPTEDEAQSLLQRSTLVLVASAAIVVAMDIFLYRLGNSDQRYFILFHLLFAAVSGFFCLMHLRRIACVVTIFVMAPFVYLAFQMAHRGSHATAVDAIVMAGVMTYAMVRYQSDFERQLH